MPKNDDTKVTPSYKGKKTPGSGRKAMIIDEELIVEALTHSRGLIMRARDYLEYTKRVVISHATLHNRIAASKRLQDIIQAERLRRAEDALAKHQEMITDGKSIHIIHMLDRWGHMVGYEDKKGDDDSQHRSAIESAYNQMEDTNE